PGLWRTAFTSSANATPPPAIADWRAPVSSFKKFIAVEPASLAKPAFVPRIAASSSADKRRIAFFIASPSIYRAHRCRIHARDTDKDRLSPFGLRRFLRPTHRCRRPTLARGILLRWRA